jgi:hypothetical protein
MNRDVDGLEQCTAFLGHCRLRGFGGNRQAANYTSIETTADMPVRLSYHASTHKNCAPPPPPTVRVIQAPKLGSLIVRKAILTTDKVAGCERLKVPAKVAFYNGKEGSAGFDHVIYKVTDSSGEVTTYDVAITVKAAPAPTGPRDKNTGTSP